VFDETRPDRFDRQALRDAYEASCGR